LGWLWAASFVLRLPPDYLLFTFLGENIYVTSQIHQISVSDAREMLVDRELSWLAFNQRVLEMAEDKSIPLLERCRFLAIFSSNLDDF
jgi:hypothetical protein